MILQKEYKQNEKLCESLRKEQDWPKTNQIYYKSNKTVSNKTATIFYDQNKVAN